MFIPIPANGLIPLLDLIKLLPELCALLDGARLRCNVNTRLIAQRLAPHRASNTLETQPNSGR